MVQVAQGVLLEWNPETFFNVVELQGMLLTNVPVVHDSVTEKLKPDDTVALIRNDGSDSWWIVGRLVVPSAKEV